jgi:DNA-binding NtrC family response regulator
MVKNIRILILEDRTSDADLVEFELMEAGLVFTPKRTVNEKEFRQALEEFSPDLILSDFDLYQYNGVLALFEAKKRCPEVPFILVTGVLDREEEDGDLIREFISRGGSDYVSKNHLDRLAPAVKKALEIDDVS